MANTVLDVQGLTKTIGNLILFKDISFSIEEGRSVGLIARNGAGKSSLLNIICGDEDYDAGEDVGGIGALHQLVDIEEQQCNEDNVYYVLNANGNHLLGN